VFRGGWCGISVWLVLVRRCGGSFVLGIGILCLCGLVVYSIPFTVIVRGLGGVRQVVVGLYSVTV